MNILNHDKCMFKITHIPNSKIPMATLVTLFKHPITQINFKIVVMMIMMVQLYCICYSLN